MFEPFTEVNTVLFTYICFFFLCSILCCILCDRAALKLIKVITIYNYEACIVVYTCIITKIISLFFSCLFFSTKRHFQLCLRKYYVIQHIYELLLLNKFQRRIVEYVQRKNAKHFVVILSKTDFWKKLILFDVCFGFLSLTRTYKRPASRYSVSKISYSS